MKGLELMLMSIYTAMQNGSNYNDPRPPEINGVLDITKLDVSIADSNLKNLEDAKPMALKVTTWQVRLIVALFFKRTYRVLGRSMQGLKGVTGHLIRNICNQGYLSPKSKDFELSWHMPYSGLKNVNGTWVGEGYAFEILHLIQRKLNFTYTIIPPDQPRIGDKTTGMMNLLYNKKVDLAVAFIPMLTELSEICAFSNIMDDVEITFLMKRPSESATGQGILAPFSDTVWLCILVAWVIFGPTMYIIIFFRTKMSSTGHREKYSLPTCMWFTYGALLKQGTTSEPMTNPSRLLFATWWIFITILTSFYTANLTAFLTLSEFTLPFNNAKDISQKHQKWVSMKFHTLDNALKREHSDALDALSKSVARKEGKIDALEDPEAMIFNLVRKGRIFLGDRTYITKLITDDYQRKTIDGVEETQRCTYVMQPNNIYVARRAFAYPLNSTYSEQINKHLMHVMETGIVKHLRMQDLPSVNICPLNLKSKERRLRNTDLTMTYKVMGVGFILSVLLFLGEVAYRYIFFDKCGKRCSSACCCCREKATTPILPMHRMHEDRHSSEYTKQNSFSAFENLYLQHRVGKDIVNGREYWVITEKDGDRRLVPIRTPSALLFQCTTD